MEKNGDFYAVLGLKKECSDAELKNAYKKLALRWHPDRCSAKANSKTLQESKEKFQQIQAAYAVLSDSNKRFLYDVGVYDGDDDNDENGMGDFMGQMARMMSQTQPSENGGQESLEDLHQLFVDMFQDDDFFAATAAGSKHGTPIERSSSLSTSSNKSVNSPPARSFSLGSNKRGAGKAKLDDFDFDFDLAAATATFGFESFDYGESFRGRGDECKRRDGRKQKISSKHDVSS